MGDRVHPWQSSADVWQETTLPQLRQHGKAIGAAALAGDKQASEIIRMYQMLYKSFDPMTHVLLAKALAEWIKL